MSFIPKAAWRPIIQIFITAATMIVVIANWSALKLSWQFIRTANISMIIAALTCLIVGSAAASIVLIMLSPGLPFGRTFGVQIASFFFNRIVPAGLGGLGLTTAYIKRQQKIPAAQAALIAAINNLLGFYVFCLGLIFFNLEHLNAVIHWPMRTTAASMLLASGGLLLVIFIARHYRLALARQLIPIKRYLNQLSRSSGRLAMALLASSSITISFIFAMWFSARAVHSPISLSHSARAFSISQAAVSVAPTPGGLGATELAGSAYLAQQLSPARAASVILTYRTVTYWLPLLPGITAYIALRRRKII